MFLTGSRAQKLAALQLNLAFDVHTHQVTHNPLSRDFARKLRRLHSFAELVENTLIAKVAELDAEVSAKAAKLSDEEKRDLYEFYAEDYIELSDELPTVLRYS